MIIHRRCHYCLLTRPSHNPVQGVLTRTPLREGGWVLENRARRRRTGKEPLRRLAAPEVEPSDTAASERVHEFDL